MNRLSTLFRGNGNGTPQPGPQTRKLSKIARRVVRLFTAGSMDRLTSDWGTSPQMADQIVLSNQRPLRARCRERFINDDYAEKFINLVESNTIGSEGILMQSRYRGAGSDRENETINRSVEEAWKRWGRKKNCDASGRLTWVGLQRAMIRATALDGEFLCLIDTADDMGEFGFGLQPIDPELLDINHNEILRDGTYVRMGIEFDRRGRVLAYWIRDPKDVSIRSGYYTGNRVRYPAENVIHCFIQEMVGQSRGLPWMSTAVWRLKMLSGYEDAAMVNARVGAAKMGAIETTDGEFKGDDKDTEGNAIIDSEPGSFFRLDPGEKLSAWDPEYPKGEFAPFVKSCLRGISSGLGVSYNSLANDLEGVNYSSIRQGVLDEREIWKSTQAWMVEDFCSEVFARWLKFAMLRKRLSIPEAAVADLPYSLHWQPRRWAWVDPLNDQQAMGIARDRGWISDSQIIRETGREPDDVWREIAADQKRKDELGVKTVATQQIVPPQPKQEPPDQTTDGSDADEVTEDASASA